MTKPNASSPETPTPRKRGRPPKDRLGDSAETRALVIQAGLALLTEKGYSAVGLDEILRNSGVPKGSFYYHFKSKEEFGLLLIEEYDRFFCRKLDKAFLDDSKTPLNRLRSFIEGAESGMARFEYRRGCLVGNLGQEMSALPERFRTRLKAVFDAWERRTASVLRQAQAQGEIAPELDCAKLAHWFWTGWEGAVLRAKLEGNTDPLHSFAEGFFFLLGSDL
ncbi:MAG: TetR/AcrR family transcriptional regulator [Rhodospirillaceae bacterium]